MSAAKKKPRRPIAGDSDDEKWSDVLVGLPRNDNARPVEWGPNVIGFLDGLWALVAKEEAAR